MKKKYLSYLIFCFSLIVLSQSKKDVYKKFDTTGMKTSILVHKSPIIDIFSLEKKESNTFNFYQAYKTVSQSDLQNRLLPLSSLKEQSKRSHFSNIIPLAILHSEFETITNNALKSNAVSKDSNGYLVRTNIDSTIFEKNQITLASPLRRNFKGLQTTFKLEKSNIYNTTKNKIELIEIDFDDKQGFRDIVLNQNISINYSEEGNKTITFKVTLENNKVIIRKSSIDIRYSNSNLRSIFNTNITTFNSSITPDLSAYGETTSYPGTGEYEIFLSSDNILDKPIFLVDGFDPEDSRDILGIYNLLGFDDNGTNSNLGDLVREEGFDVVILNFPIYTRAADAAIIDGGVDFIERNAMLLVDLINLINAQKTGNEENVLIGPSMGGLISRYALNYMENQNMSHDTRLWISFDAPHHGANVPIGFQHQFNFLAFGLDDFWVLGDQNVEELQPIIDGMLKSSAARQMLTDQFEPHITNSDGVTFNENLVLPISHPFKTIFYSSLNSLTDSGFPEQTRNISIINGSGNNSRYPDNTANANDLLPGSLILDADINVMTGADMLIETYFTPDAGTQIRTSKVHLDFAWWFPLANDRHNNADSRAFAFSNGIDAASGGLFDISNLTEDLATDGLVGEFLSALQTDYFNFIPSISAMAFEITNNEIDWFYTPSSVVSNQSTTNITPFDAWYMPTENEPHVTLTEENVEFALSEIILETLNLENEEISIRLEKNPIDNELVILSNQIFENLNVRIYSLLGEELINLKINKFEDRISIPIKLSSGVYILNLSNDKLFHSIRIIVN